MDKMLYVAMSGAKQAMLSQTVRANNLANASTNGFKRDFEQARSMQVFGDHFPSRVYSMTEIPASDMASGSLVKTDRELDVSVNGEGWFVVLDQSGNEAFTRAGNFSLRPDGTLVTQEGNTVMGNNGPVVIPPAEKIEFGADGTVSVRGLGQNPNALTEIGRLKLVRPPQANLVKGEDGMFRTKDGLVQDVDGGVRVVSGMLEESNVNVVEEMMSIISSSRRFEMQVKLMKKAEEADGAAARLLQSS